MTIKIITASLVLALAMGVGACQKAGGDSVMGVLTEKPEEPTTHVVKSDEEWKEALTAEQYRILRKSGTERAFGAVYKEFQAQGAGSYVCAGCNAELFSSKTKFDSHSGWPSFYEPAKSENVKEISDTSGGFVRTEVRCAKCDGHLGHVFAGEDFGNPTDQRYCINGAILSFVPEGVPAAGESKEVEATEAATKVDGEVEAAPKTEE